MLPGLAIRAVLDARKRLKVKWQLRDKDRRTTLFSIIKRESATSVEVSVGAVDEW